ncbi:C1 family peptidase [Flavobacteriaceae bacterium]|nr:C1 family peptidase [Flavobacteriaceae bacterium]
MKILHFKLLLFFLVFQFTRLNAQGYIKHNFDLISQYDSYSKEGFGFADDIPIRKSLEKYVPAIGNQRNTGSCVAWATTYYNLSIIYNKMFGITTYRDKFSHSYDPWFTYSLVNKFYNNSTDCNEGLRFGDTFTFLENFGPKKLFLPPNDMSCSTSISDSNLDVIKRYSNPYRVSKVEYEMAYDGDAYNYPLTDRQVNLIKTEIGKYSFPVVVGFSNYGNTLNEVDSNGFWYPKYSFGGGHAMTVVGYDDTLNGGSFRVVNSWGSGWGDNGYAWIRYSDFKKFCDIAMFTWITSNIQTEMLQIKDLDSYTRSYGNNKTRIYEGEKDNNEYTGYGIVSFIDDDAHYAGWFENGNMNGTFRVFNEDGLYEIEYDMGRVVDRTKLGFADKEKNTEELENTNDYIRNMFPSFRFKNIADDFEKVTNDKVVD